MTCLSRMIARHTRMLCRVACDSQEFVVALLYVSFHDISSTQSVSRWPMPQQAARAVLWQMILAYKSANIAMKVEERINARRDSSHESIKRSLRALQKRDSSGRGLSGKPLHNVAHGHDCGGNRSRLSAWLAKQGWTLYTNTLCKQILCNSLCCVLRVVISSSRFDPAD